jgi:hypothetical protein
MGRLHNSGSVGVLDGVLDVTDYPFKADGSGRDDATAALQGALDFARHNYMTVYLPVGVYTVRYSWVTCAFADASTQVTAPLTAFQYPRMAADGDGCFNGKFGS